MVRLTRVQQQARTRAAVLAAAREEFAEHGFVPAKVDRIAERAELTRGAVYSNFPSKRALYLAVLIDQVEKSGSDEPQASVSSTSKVDALGVFARVWLERLPLVGDSAPGGRLQLRSLDGVFEDEHGPAVLAQAARLEALLLAIALERGAPARQVRLAELVLTLLDGAGHRAETSPGFGDPFDVAHACRHLATIDLKDTWAPPHLPYVAPARTCADAWTAPEGLVDQISGDQVDLADGLVVVLGAGRLGAAEEAVRSAKPGEQVTVVIVTGDAEETGRLVRLRVTDAVGCLRRVFAPEVWQHVRLVLDDDALVASAIGVTNPGDDTESAVSVRNGVIVARAHGRGAGHAAGARRREATS
ncbi:DNA-binding transcriptional regulator, AcrR family [Lentzea waywayandensis]|uniref:DNA-binding transcriptional regulator, AcrR family n=1 Tax=Lentzea waywayandensis TaxID=84724 RepID=A0A1I6DG20_9PSEU|nr:TetR/AcrR family transcriptional regulator [Lentzea waywayandensis]SFR04379.1 DNA-binding transcriptional regulator, AcrR family [Lentzea waywayandensis]